jgi:PhnB protein
MSKIVSKPGNIPWVSPYIMVKDVDKAVDFYVKAFGFQVKEVAPDEDGSGVHAELTYNDQLIMLGKQGAFGGTTTAPSTSNVESPITLYAYADNVDDFYQHAITNHAEGKQAPEDSFWGDRMCQLQDLDGYIWCFASRLEA